MPQLNTYFLVKLLGFFNRDELEKNLQLTSKRFNLMILKYFSSKPYRYLDNVSVFIKRGLLQGRLRFQKDALFLQDKTFWNINDRKWGNEELTEYNYLIKKIRPFLAENLRVCNVIIDLSSYRRISQEDIAALESVAHIWDSCKMEIITDQYFSENYLGAYERLLADAKILCCRRLKCSGDILDLQLFNYPVVYTLSELEVDFTDFTPITEHEMKAMDSLVESQALYPRSKTVFVLKEYFLFWWQSRKDDICNKFAMSEMPRHLRIVFVLPAIIPHNTLTFSRLRNYRTQEALEFRSVDYNEVAEHCAFESDLNYFILQRFKI